MFVVHRLRSDFPIHREVLLLFCYSMRYDYETNLLIPKSIVILADNLVGGVFDLKRFHGAGGEEMGQCPIPRTRHIAI